jgi:DNA-binding CsgD family transcriptional regulator
MPGPILGSAGAAAEHAIVRSCSRDLAPLDLLEHVAGRVGTVVPYAAAGWLTVDPATLLHTGAFAENVPADVHMRLIDNELAVDDFAKFSVIARLPRPVLRLRDATAGELGRSPRHRLVNAPAGWEPELRVAFRSRGSCWGVACLTRARGEPDFSDAEADFMAAIAEHVGHGLRSGLLLEGCSTGAATDTTPGMIVLTDEGEVESLTEEAERWLGELASSGLSVPPVVVAVARRARACAGTDASRAPASARVLLPSGRWLLVSGARLTSTDGQPRTAVMLEPARRADLATLVLERHELTDREVEVTDLLARGLSTGEIASTLGISPHTVGDHVKSVFAKLGVTSRPQLTALLFHEHVLPGFRVHEGAQRATGSHPHTGRPR